MLERECGFSTATDDWKEAEWTERNFAGITGKARFGIGVAEARLADLDETPGEKVRLGKKGFAIELGPWKMQTCLVPLRPVAGSK